VFLTGTQWRAWNGRLAVGVMGGNRLAILNINNSGVATSEVTASTLPATRYRALTMGPDGALYIATDAGEIWRVTAAAATP